MRSHAVGTSHMIFQCALLLLQWITTKSKLSLIHRFPVRMPFEQGVSTTFFAIQPSLKGPYHYETVWILNFALFRRISMATILFGHRQLHHNSDPNRKTVAKVTSKYQLWCPPGSWSSTMIGVISLKTQLFDVLVSVDSQLNPSIALQ